MKIQLKADEVSKVVKVNFQTVYESSFQTLQKIEAVKEWVIHREGVFRAAYC